MRSLALGLLLILPDAAWAQADPDAVDRQVEQRIETAKQLYGVPDPRLRCRPKPGSDEIVVCRDRGEDQQVGRSDPDPNTMEGRRALDGGVPRAPQFDKGYCKECPHFGSVPPPVYYIDVTKLPEAPPGSDADKIAKGEMEAP
ncbi:MULTISPECIES: hypothetical protein [unclassified Novosphingobium]|uniref:hypothetical protein n=1 Tax=unclassified Novosphingobium TaxID=2644732 RepID=UPI000EE50FC7|nr:MULTISPECIES: hypothetical protein [unclassified Novosphingobium]HCF25285.1 hypothetical protein [Novosphingobium sp.]HQV02553.1 hypothetical protein [Novosphingobium sp.]